VILFDFGHVPAAGRAPYPAVPSYEELAALVVAQATVIESLQERLACLEAEGVALRRQVERDSSN